MLHRVRNVYSLADYRLCIRFVEGFTKIYDMKPLMKERPMYKLLDASEEFYGVYADVGGYGIVWNDGIDLSCDELWDNGVTIETPFDGHLAFCEAAKSWGLDESELRVAVSRGKLVNGVDACRFGGQWVVTMDAMKREYGDMPSSARTWHIQKDGGAGAGNTAFPAFLSDVKIPFMYCVLSRRML